MGERDEVRQRDIFSSPPGRERDTERERERMREKEREREIGRLPNFASLSACGE